MPALWFPRDVHNKVEEAVNPVDEEGDGGDDKTDEGEGLVGQYQVCPPGVQHKGPRGEHEAKEEAERGGGVTRGEDKEQSHWPRQRVFRE